MLVRVAGTHGGDDFELIDNSEALATFVALHLTADLYISDYVDYRSTDGYFRKYRAIVTAGIVFPYHLAIGTHWKLHHFRTDMGSHAWMQHEEEAFLRNPNTVLTKAHRDALSAIDLKLGLEFYGVDFGIARDGVMVIFEVNASMLVQPDDSAFAYKMATNERVKAAYAAMLAQAASGAHL